MQIKQKREIVSVLTNTHFPLKDQTLLAASIVEMLEYFDSFTPDAGQDDSFRFHEISFPALDYKWLIFGGKQPADIDAVALNYHGVPLPRKLYVLQPLFLYRDTA